MGGAHHSRARGPVVRRARVLEPRLRNGSAAGRGMAPRHARARRLGISGEQRVRRSRRAAAARLEKPEKGERDRDCRSHPHDHPRGPRREKAMEAGRALRRLCRPRHLREDWLRADGGPRRRAPRRPPRKAPELGVNGVQLMWIRRALSTLVVLFLLFDGVSKLMDIQPVQRAMAELGYPGDTGVKIGVVALACAALYAFPPTAVLGAVLITGLCGGGIASPLRIGSPLFSHVPVGPYLRAAPWARPWPRRQ